jgi:hypothetical protein
MALKMLKLSSIELTTGSLAPYFEHSKTAWDLEKFSPTII